MSHKSIVFILLLLSVICVKANAIDWGEISLDFGTDLVSKTIIKGQYEYTNVGYNSTNLHFLKCLADTSYRSWQHRSSYLFSINYAHILSLRENTFLIGFGIKLYKKSAPAGNLAYNDAGPRYVTIFTGVNDQNIQDSMVTVVHSLRDLYIIPLYFSVQVNPLNRIPSIYSKANIGYSLVINDLLTTTKYTNSSIYEYRREGKIYFGLELGKESKLTEKVSLLLSLFYDYVEYKTVCSELGKNHRHLRCSEFTNADHMIGIKAGIKFKLYKSILREKV
jgi:hypothetical protein